MHSSISTRCALEYGLGYNFKYAKKSGTPNALVSERNVGSPCGSTQIGYWSGIRQILIASFCSLET